MLRDVIQAAGLGFFPSVALVIFIAVFLGVLTHEFRRPKHNAQRMANLPNEEQH